VQTEVQTNGQWSNRRRFVVPSLLAMATFADAGYRATRETHDPALAFVSSLITAAILTVPLLALLSSPALLFRSGRTIDGWLKAYGWVAAVFIGLLVLLRLTSLLLQLVRN